MKTGGYNLGRIIPLWGRSQRNRWSLKEGLKSSVSLDLLCGLEDLMREPLEDSLSVLRSRVIESEDSYEIQAR
jgi:hypothetical protein